MSCALAEARDGDRRMDQPDTIQTIQFEEYQPI